MRSRRRRVLATAPWVRGPLLALAQPMALVAVAAAAALLGLVVAAGPLFTSSVSTAALHQAAGKRCVQDDRISLINPAANPFRTLQAGPQSAADVRAADPVVRDAFARQGLPDPVLTTYAVVPTGDTSGQRPADVGLFASPGALDHVRVLARVPGNGVYLPDTYADRLAVHAGDLLPLATGGIRIVGVYADLDTAGYRTVLPAHWCHWRDLIVTSVSSRPPPFVLADPATVAALGTDLQAEWTSPVDVGALTVAEARQVAAGGSALFGRSDLDPDNSSSVVSGYTERTSLDADLRLTDRLVAAVGTPVTAIATAAGLLALVLVAGAGLLWTHRRRTELALLSARGTGPAALGVKAAAELGLPTAVGCALGWAAGVELVPLLGPSGLTEPGAPTRALAATALAWIAATATEVLAVAVVLRERRGGRTALRWAPPAAVAVLLGASASLFATAGGRRQVVLPGVERLDPVLLLAPLLGLTGLVLAVALLAAAPLQRARVPARRRTTAVYLAVHRAAASRTAVVVVLCGLAVPVGLACYSSGFTASTAATVDAKAQLYTGAPVALALRVGLGQLPEADTDGTPVSYALAQATGAGTVDDQGREVELLGVDPRTFARYAYDDPEVTGAQLPELLRGLRSPATGPAPALLIGAGGDPSPTTVRVRGSVLPVHVLRRAPAFPGMRFPDRPAVVVDLAAVQGLDPFGNWQNELWTDQRHVGELLTSLTDRGVLTDDVEQPGTFVDAASLLPVTWTFAFLRAVSAAVAVVSGAGLLMLLAARQRRQEAAYVLMSRMGLSRRTHRRSLAWELGGLTGTAWLSGTVAAGAALLVATAAIDVDPGFLPPTLVRLPVGTAAWSALGLGCLAVVLVVLAQRRADRADPGIVLRE